MGRTASTERQCLHKGAIFLTSYPDVRTIRTRNSDYFWRQSGAAQGGWIGLKT